MKKYIVKCDIEALFLKKGDILVINNGIPCLERNIKQGFPFVDIHNVKFFEEYNDKFKIGEYVIYEKNLYIVNKINRVHKMYDLSFIGSNKIVVKNISETWLKKAEIYYFLSSKGVVQSAIIDKDEVADKWRKLTNNFFMNKEDAQKRKDELINKKLYSKKYNKH